MKCFKSRYYLVGEIIVSHIQSSISVVEYNETKREYMILPITKIAFVIERKRACIYNISESNLRYNLRNKFCQKNVFVVRLFPKARKCKIYHPDRNLEFADFMIL